MPCTECNQNQYPKRLDNNYAKFRVKVSREGENSVEYETKKARNIRNLTGRKISFLEVFADYLYLKSGRSK